MVKKPATCHPDRLAYVKGMCSKCYEAQRRRAKGIKPWHAQPILCHPDRPRHSKGLCSTCYKKAYREANHSNSEYLKRISISGKKTYSKYASRDKQNQRMRKRIVINKLGGKCIYCGEARLGFLTLGHKYDDGATHRRAIFNGRLGDLYEYLMRHDFPVRDVEKLQIECISCNESKTKKYLVLDDSELTAVQRYEKRVITTCIEHYGGAICVCCGESDLARLTFGHVNNDGKKHRNENGGLRGASLCGWLIKA